MLNAISKVILFYKVEKNYLPNDECVVICEIDNTRSKREITRVKC